MPNASNTDRVVRRHRRDRRHRVSGPILAVQGPDARQRLAALSPAARRSRSLPRRRVEHRRRSELVVAGTGYTGEDGVEIAVPNEAGRRALRAPRSPPGSMPAGLGARDTLRLEAGLPLHGHELGAGITPLQAGLGWVVGWSKPSFRGREALLAEREAGPTSAPARHPRHAAASRCATAPRSSGAEHRSGDDQLGNFSPMLGVGIALGLRRHRRRSRGRRPGRGRGAGSQDPRRHRPAAVLAPEELSHVPDYTPHTPPRSSAMLAFLGHR